MHVGQKDAQWLKDMDILTVYEKTKEKLTACMVAAASKGATQDVSVVPFARTVASLVTATIHDCSLPRRPAHSSKLFFPTSVTPKKRLRLGRSA